MKFDIWKSVSYIFSNKKNIGNFLIFLALILVYLFFGVLRSFCISPHYFNDIQNQLSLAVMNFAPYSLLQFQGFPVVLPYLISFDMMQLAFGKFNISSVNAIGMIFLASCIISTVIGYFLYNTREQIFTKDFSMPDFKNLFNYFKKGFICLYGIVILTIPAVIINIFGAKCIYSYFNNLTGPDLSWLYAEIRPMLVMALTSIIAFVLFFYLSAAIIPFITNFKFKSLFKIKTTFSIIFGNFKVYIKYAGWQLLFTIILGMFISVAMFLHTMILELNVYRFEIEGFLNSDSTISLWVSFILILLMMPILFWYCSVISNLQTQFILYLIKAKEENKSPAQKNITTAQPKQKQITKNQKITAIFVISLFAVIFSLTAIHYYKIHSVVNGYLQKLELYGRTFYYLKDEYGTLDTWNPKNAADVFNKMQAYLPVAKVCGFSDDEGACFEEDYPKLNNKGFVNITKKSFYKFKLTDGSTGALYYNFPKCNINDSVTGDGPLNAICGSIWFDINGKTKPNVYGRDLFQLVITKSGELVPRGHEDDKVYSVSGNCSNTKQSGDACGAWILYNNNLDYLKK